MPSPRKKKSGTPKKKNSMSPLRYERGRSPTRNVSPVTKTHPLSRLEVSSTENLEVAREWTVVSSENRLLGIYVHASTMKELKLHSGSLVIVFPSVLIESDHQMDSDGLPISLPTIICPIYISRSCSTSEIEMKRWQRETLRIALGYQISMQPYIPSQQAQQLTYSRASKKEIFLNQTKTIFIHPINTAELITIVSIGPKPLSEQIQSLAFSSLLKRKYISLHTLIFVTFFGQQYTFRIHEISTDEKSPYIENSENSLQILLVHPQTSLRIICEEKEENGFDVKKDVPEKQVAIGGLSKEVEQIENQVKLCLYHWKDFRKYGLKSPRGILLFGPPGTGKTLMVKVISKKLQCSLFIINGPEIMGKVHGESESRLRDVFNKAKRNQPSIIFIDEIDAICSKRESLESQFEKRIVSQLLSCLDSLHATDSQSESSIIVLGATNRPNSLDTALRRPGRFDKEIEIGIPNPQQRREILDLYMNSIRHSLEEEDLHYFANSSHGYVGADIAALCREACITSLLRSKKMIHDLPSSIVKKQEKSSSKLMKQHKEHILVSTDDMKCAMSKIRPSTMRELMIEVPTVHWEDIGGNEETKQKLKEAVEWPLLYPEAFERMGIRPPRGILLYGPPGCSKTMMAKALATEAGLNFIAVKGPELFSKWVGESERAIRELFRKARAAAPSIVFFDEIDALAIKRGGSDAGGVADRVLSQLLTELDGVEPLKKVTVVAATNRPDIIDKALLRPGRIDRIVYVGLPDAQAREHIIRIHLNKIPTDDSIHVDSIVQQTVSYSGAEVVAVCKEASMFALTENIDIDSVSMKHFKQALEKVKPRITKEMISFYDKFQNSVKL